MRHARTDVQGGLPGEGSRHDFGDGRTGFAGTARLAPSQVVEIVTPGGGYGPPAGRPPADVARDVAEGRIDEAAAGHGILIRPDFSVGSHQ